MSIIEPPERWEMRNSWERQTWLNVFYEYVIRKFRALTGPLTTDFQSLENSTVALRLITDSADRTIRGVQTDETEVSKITLGDDEVIIGGDLVTETKTPASAGATGTAGTIAWDSSFVYVCTATDTWKRVAIATW